MRTIVTLEDELEINDFYKDLFEDFNYSVISTTSYQEVLAVFEQQHVDLLLVDNFLQYSRSDKNGFETAFEMKQMYPNTKLIMVSAHYPQEFDNKYADYGFDLVLHKPFDIKALVDSVRELIPIAA